MHIIATIRKRGYAPGVITSVIVYLPLSIYSYYFFISTGELHLKQFIISVILGAVYQIVPLIYFVIALKLKGNSRSS
jgi:hypothetical protein